MEIKLSIRDRLKLAELMSSEVGSFATMKLIRVLLEELSLSDEEIKACSFKQIPGDNGTSQMLWLEEKDPMKLCQIGEVALTTIQRKLKQLDSCNALKNDQLDLYEKFAGA